MFDITSLSSLLTDSHMIFRLMSINYFNGVVPPQILVGLKCAFSGAITPVSSVTGNH